MEKKNFEIIKEQEEPTINDVAPISFSFNESSKIIILNQNHILKETSTFSSSIFNTDIINLTFVSDKPYMFGAKVNKRKKEKDYEMDDYEKN